MCEQVAQCISTFFGLQSVVCRALGSHTSTRTRTRTCARTHTHTHTHAHAPLTDRHRHARTRISSCIGNAHLSVNSGVTALILHDPSEVFVGHDPSTSITVCVYLRCEENEQVSPMLSLARKFSTTKKTQLVATAMQGQLFHDHGHANRVIIAVSIQERGARIHVNTMLAWPWPRRCKCCKVYAQSQT